MLQRELLTAAEHRARHKQGQPFSVAADPDVRAFIDRNIATMNFRELAAAALSEFGKGRAPSKAAIHRYWQALPNDYRERLVQASSSRRRGGKV